MNPISDLITEPDGQPYDWGATGPDAYDCSGLVDAVLKELE